MAKYDKIKNFKSEGFIKQNKSLIIGILIVILFWRPIKNLLQKLTDFTTTDEGEQEAVSNAVLDVLNSEVDYSQIELTSGEVQGIAQALRVELGYAPTWPWGEWPGEASKIFKLLCKNANELHNDIYHHFTPEGYIRNSGTYTFRNGWDEETVYIKKFIPYSKGVLKAIFSEFGTPTYSHSIGGSPTGISQYTSDYIVGWEDDWNLQNWCSVQMSTGQYKIMKAIFSGTGLF